MESVVVSIILTLTVIAVFVASAWTFELPEIAAALVKRFMTRHRGRRKRRRKAVRAGEAAYKAILDYHEYKRTRNEADRHRWYTEFKRLGGIPEPVVVPTGPPQTSPLSEQMFVPRAPYVVKSMDGGVRVFDWTGRLIGRE